MAGLCTAAMISSMVVPVWAAEETTEEAADDGDVADVSEAMLGLWKDSAGDIYGFYKDNSFFGQWKDEEQDDRYGCSQKAPRSQGYSCSDFYFKQ